MGELVKMSVVQYETGWNHKIESVLDPFCSREAVLFDAHAPSHIVLLIHHSGCIAISPGLRPGGVKGANYTVAINDDTAQVVDVAKRTSVDLAAGDRLTLRCQVADKYGSWNYWVLENAKLIPPETVIIGCGRSPHLGDAIAILFGLEQYSEANDQTAFVTPEPLFIQLLEIFDFKHIKITDLPYTLDAMHLFPSIPWEGFWPQRFGRYLANRIGGRFEGSELPSPHLALVKQGDIILCQFDSRSAANIPMLSIRRLLSSLFPGRPIAAIGGADTSPYLGPDFEYRRGDLHFIATELQKCRHFIGADSGIAHLAGVLGVPCTVINLIECRIVQSFFGGYPLTAVFDRAHLFELLRIDIPGELGLGSHSAIKYFSQYQEDRWIAENIAIPDGGVIVEVGVGRWRENSNSLHFERRGWQVILVEPNPVLHEEILANRKGKLFKCACGNYDGETHFIQENEPTLSGILRSVEGVNCRKICVPIRTLNSILDEAAVGHPTILSLDTESTELEIWDALDLEKHAPDIVIFEYNTVGFPERPIPIIQRFLDDGYSLVHTTDANLIFRKTTTG